MSRGSTTGVPDEPHQAPWNSSSRNNLVLRHNQGSDGTTYCNVATILRPKTKAEEADEKRVRAATEKVKEESRRPHMVTRPEPDAVEITDGDVPF